MTREDILNEIEVLKTELDYFKGKGELSKDEERDMWNEINDLEKQLEKMGD